jgi:hypothetical protein
VAREQDAGKGLTVAGVRSHLDDLDSHGRRRAPRLAVEHRVDPDLARPGGRKPAAELLDVLAGDNLEPWTHAERRVEVQDLRDPVGVPRPEPVDGVHEVDLGLVRLDDRDGVAEALDADAGTPEPLDAERDPGPLQPGDELGADRPEAQASDPRTTTMPGTGR